MFLWPVVHPGDRNSGPRNPPPVESFQPAAFFNIVNVGDVFPRWQRYTIQDFLKTRSNLTGALYTSKRWEIALVDAIYDILTEVGIRRGCSIEKPIAFNDFVEFITGVNEASQRIPWAGRVRCLDYGCSWANERAG